MARQNRVTPFGELISVADRGMFWGNRGPLLNSRGELARYSRGNAWVTCLLEFKGRKRQQWQPGRLTEIYFLDEATGLAAGHRPCGECRYREYQAFRRAFAAVYPAGPYAGVPLPGVGEIDARLHQNRLRNVRTHDVPLREDRQGTRPADAHPAEDAPPGARPHHARREDRPHDAPPGADAPHGDRPTEDAPPGARPHDARHGDRLIAPGARRTYTATIGGLPDGAMVSLADRAWLIRRDAAGLDARRLHRTPIGRPSSRSHRDHPPRDRRHPDRGLPPRPAPNRDTSRQPLTQPRPTAPTVFGPNPEPDPQPQSQPEPQSGFRPKPGPGPQPEPGPQPRDRPNRSRPNPAADRTLTPPRSTPNYANIHIS